MCECICREEGAVIECTQGLCHLWYGFRNPAVKAYQTLQQRGVPIQKVSMGQKHCALLTVQGQVYTYGNNNSGQLGTGNYDDQYVEPVLVEELCDSFIVDISCGKWHSAAVSSTGHVYCWGSSTQGQCGNQLRDNPKPVIVNLVKLPCTSDESVQQSPLIESTSRHTTTSQTFVQKASRSKTVQSNSTPVEPSQQPLYQEPPKNVLEDCDGVEEGVGIPVKVVQVECGGSHTLAVCEEGELWGWGSGAYLGLNISETAPCSVPRRIDFMVGRKVIKVSCGERHTLSLVQKLPLSSQLYRDNNTLVARESHLVTQKTKKRDNAIDRSKVDPSVRLRLSSEQSSCESSMCDKCNSPVRQPKGSVCQYEEDAETLHVCPLGLEVTSGNRSSQQSSLLSSGKASKSGSSRLSLDSRSLDTDSTCSELDPLGGAVYQTAESSPLVENRTLAIKRCSSSSSEEVPVAESQGNNRDDAVKMEETKKGGGSDDSVEQLTLDEIEVVVEELKAFGKKDHGKERINTEEQRSNYVKDGTEEKAELKGIASCGTEKVTIEGVGRAVLKREEDIDTNIIIVEDTIGQNQVEKVETGDEDADAVKAKQGTIRDVLEKQTDIDLELKIGIDEETTETHVNKGENDIKNVQSVADDVVIDDKSVEQCSKEQITTISNDCISIGLSSSRQAIEAGQGEDLSSQVTVATNGGENVSKKPPGEGDKACDIIVSTSAIASDEHDISRSSGRPTCDDGDQKYCVLDVSNSETDGIPSESISRDTSQVPLNMIPHETTDTDSTPQESNELNNEDEQPVKDDILRQKSSSSTRPKQLSVRDSSDSIVGSLTKSRSTFLDETEAKEFLDRQLSGDDVLVVETSTEGSITGPLTKKVENILQYVPNTSTAIAMLEYGKSWTTSVVTNIRSQVETTMDRFSIVSSLGSSMDGEEVKGQGGLEENQDVEQAQEGLPEVNFQRFGSLPKSTSMGAVPGRKLTTEQRHKRRGSLPSGAIQSNKTAIFFSGEVVMETELWSWGDGGQGQLGHGDTLDRLQPCKLKFFSDKKVVDISAGNFHSLVLTANSQVYSWGCNTSRQLGHDDLQGSTSPQKVKIDRGLTVSGIAAGDNHSVVLADDRNFCPAVYFSGTEPGKPGTKDDIASEFTCIPNLQKVGQVKSVSAGGDLCCCLSDKQTSNHRSTLYEFAATERLFGLHLHLISEELLKPLLNSDAFQSKDSSQLGMSLGILCDAFFCLSDMTSQNHLELRKILENTRDLTELQLLSKSEQCIGAYQHYCKCYTDVLAIGGFKTSGKLCSSLFTKSKELITSVLETKSFHSKDAGSTFLKLMKLPLSRLKDYCKMLSRLALKFSTFTREKQVLDTASRLWETFCQISVQDVKRAENTNLFWSTCPTKLADTLRIASRRLLFDSKTYPLTYQGGGRFTTHLFLLFNDIFAHVQGSYINTYSLSTIWLETASSDKDVASGNFIKLVMPEDSLTVVTPSPMLKSEWIWAFNQAIDKALSQQRYSNDTKSNGPTLSPPRERHASHKFTKHALFKDAKYEGMWRLGYMHGQGELQWPDGRRFHGAFKNGCQDGYGVYTVQHEEGEKEVYDGVWRQGKLCGYGYVKYTNGDSYEGHFREGKRHGHGVLKQGKLTSSLASIYIGEWAMDRKSGYGVYEDILKGQKYMGLWLEDQKHGNGVIVTLDGMYFEGTFQQNKMTGYGLLMTDDNTCYEGEFAGGPNLYGKGALTLPNGDYIEGTFNGSFSEGIKTNGTFFKAPEDTSVRHGFSHALGIIPKSFGRLSVPAHRKWEEIFDQCCSMLGCTKHSSSTDSFKAWEKCAALIEIGKKMASGSARASKGKGKSQGVVPSELETIPEYSRGNLSIEYYTKIKSYVTKAFEWPHHPLGRLLESLVDVYRATYVGVGAHPRLLHHAVQEVHSFLERVYPIVRILFPDLPDGSSVVQIVRENFDESTSFQYTDEDICEVVTTGSLLYPILLPKIYPPLFTLYALYNEKEDERYWRRVVTWNKQSDLALMSYLGIDQRFWTFEEHNMESPQRLSKIRDRSYMEAIETLQGISTSFSPADKLYLIQNTFNKINKIVQDKLGRAYLWCMDDLFPVFQYVVVRSRIQHLGAEIHFMDDLMEPYLEHGELGLMFTTLKASYYQIQNEKIA